MFYIDLNDESFLCFFFPVLLLFFNLIAQFMLLLPKD
jgi:hypothetical protein